MAPSPGGRKTRSGRASQHPMPVSMSAKRRQRALEVEWTGNHSMCPSRSIVFVNHAKEQPWGSCVRVHLFIRRVHDSLPLITLYSSRWLQDKPSMSTILYPYMMYHVSMSRRIYGLMAPHANTCQSQSRQRRRSIPKHHSQSFIHSFIQPSIIQSRKYRKHRPVGQWELW